MATLKVKDADGNWQVIKDPASATQNEDIVLLKEQVGDTETALDNIIAIQNSLTGGDAE